MELSVLFRILPTKRLSSFRTSEPLQTPTLPREATQKPGVEWRGVARRVQ